MPLRTLQEWLGHRDYETTLVYADYQPDHRREAELVERAFKTGHNSGHNLSETESNQTNQYRTAKRYRTHPWNGGLITRRSRFESRPQEAARRAAFVVSAARPQCEGQPPGYQARTKAPETLQARALEVRHPRRGRFHGKRQCVGIGAALPLSGGSGSRRRTVRSVSDLTPRRAGRSVEAGMRHLVALVSAALCSTRRACRRPAVSGLDPAAGRLRSRGHATGAGTTFYAD